VSTRSQYARLVGRAFTEEELKLLLLRRQFREAYEKMDRIEDSDAVIRMGGAIMGEKEWKKKH